VSEPLYILLDSGRDLENRARHAEALFHGIDDAVFVHDLEGRILDANPAACRRLGYTRDELLRLRTRDIDDPSFAADFGKRLREQMAAGHLSCEGRHRTKDGRVIPVDINSSVIEIDGKRAVLAVMRDISRRKAAERRLEAQYAVTRVLAEAATLREATPRLLRAICEGVGWDAGAIWTVDALSGVLRCLDYWHTSAFEDPTFEELTRQSKYAPYEGLAGRVWTRGEPTWIADVAAEDWLPQGPAALQAGIHTVLAFPIYCGEATTGVIEFFCRRVREPEPEELSMLAALGSQVGQFVDRKQVEEERDRFFLLSLDLLCMASFDGRFRRVNPAWERVLGYRLEELIAEPFLHFVHPDDRKATAAEMRHLATGAETISFQNRYRHKDGSYRWLEWTATPLLDEQLVYAAARDITAYKGAEQENQRANAFLDSIIENIPSMIFVKEAAQLRFERINRAGETLLGLRRGELIGKNDYDLFPPGQADFFVEKDREVLEGRQLLDVTEEEIKTRDGRRIIHTRKIPILDDKGEPKYLLGISEDITEHKVLEDTRRRYAEERDRHAQELEAKNQALAESERRYRQLTEAALDAIVVADQAGNLILFNRAAEYTFGYRAEELLGRPLTELMPEDFRVRHSAGLSRYVETRQGQLVGKTVELRGRRKDGSEFPLELSLSAIDLGNELQFLGAIRDLTERNRMRAVVAQTEKLASIGLLSAGVAHEINNPLAYVANNLAVLQRDTKGAMELLAIYEEAREGLAKVDPEAAERAKELAEEIDLTYIRENLDRLLARTREGVQRVTKIVQDLRGLARTAPPQMEEANLPDLVDMSLEMIRGRLRRQGISVDLDYGTTPKVRCVATQISQVLLNLLVNALQALETHGRPGEGRIRVSTRRVGDELVLEVADNGPGIAAEHLPHLFDPFFTTKPVGEGTGLGLSISHGIVTGHGGRIEVDSRPGQGSCFHIFLPLNPARGRA
jgi:PAS domain S-box-containing protein